ncbi:MAG: hypothetical protein Q7T46_11505 [Polaromonas sp.]|nr:hypothetical protein [Polaromonas sp.]
MKELTYLIYIIFWESLIFGGTGYAVFVLDRSGWWFLLALFIGGTAYSPLKWIHGKDTK